MSMKKGDLVTVVQNLEEKGHGIQSIFPIMKLFSNSVCQVEEVGSRSYRLHYPVMELSFYFDKQLVEGARLYHEF